MLEASPEPEVPYSSQFARRFPPNYLRATAGTALDQRRKHPIKQTRGCVAKNICFSHGRVRITEVFCTPAKRLAYRALPPLVHRCASRRCRLDLGGYSVRKRGK